MRRLTPFVFLLLTLMVPFSLCAQRVGQPRVPTQGGAGGGFGSGPTLGSPNVNNQPMQSFSVNGRVWSTEGDTGLDGIEVDLRAFSGGTVGTAFTSGNGNFQFNNVAGGNYTVVTSGPGFQPASQDIQVEGSVFGVLVEVRRIREGGVAGKGSGKVSLRELSIPHKAHDAMEKGMSLLYGKRDAAGSLKQFEKAIQFYADYYEAYLQMGVAYIRLKDGPNAEQSLRKSVELSQQKYPDAMIWLASLLSDGRRFADAEPMARTAAELAPDSWQANFELSRALLGLERTEEAEKLAMIAVKIQPQAPMIRLLLADLHRMRDNLPALLDDLDAYLKLEPTGPLADRVRGDREELQKELGAAQAGPRSGLPPSQAPPPAQSAPAPSTEKP